MKLLNKLFGRREDNSIYDDKILSDDLFKDIRKEYIDYILNELLNIDNWTAIDSYRKGEEHLGRSITNKNNHIRIDNDCLFSITPINIDFTTEEKALIKPLISKILLRDMRILIDKLKYNSLNE